jgi:hypothetical protein
VPDPNEPDGRKRDENGKPVVSRIGDKAMAELARVTRGSYRQANGLSDGDLKRVAADIARTPTRGPAPWRVDSWLIGAAFLILVVDGLRPARFIVP